MAAKWRADGAGHACIMQLPCEAEGRVNKQRRQAKVKKVMGEFKRGELHSGSKSGPEVSDPKQAIAIALSQARKEE